MVKVMPSFRPPQLVSNSVPARYPLKGEPIYNIIKERIKDLDSKSIDAGSLEQIYPQYIPRGEICPICKMPFDKGKKRKLVDQCGHEKCYSCLFKSDKCLVCALQAPPKKAQHFMPRIPFSVSIGRSKLKTNGTFFSQRATNADPGLPPEHPSPRQSLFSAFSSRRQASIANPKSGRKTPLSDVDLSFSSIPDRATSDSNSTLCDVKSLDSDRNTGSHTDSDDLYASFSLLKSSVYSPKSSLKRGERMRTPMTNSFSSLSTFSSEANTSSSSSSPPQPRRSNKPILPKSLEVMLKPLFFEVPQEHPDPIFTGRSWLFKEIEQKLRMETGSNKGITIVGQTGTGKTAAILQMLDYSCFGRKRDERMYQDIYSRSDPNGSVDFIPEGVWPLSQMVVAYHFCQADNAVTCHIPDFIHSIAAQLCQAPQLYAYRDLFLSDSNLQSLLSLSSCIKDPDASFTQGILEPMHSLRRLGKISTDPVAILIDGLCEAEYHNPEYGGSLAQFLSRHVAKIPNFLKLIVTVRTEFQEIANFLPFHTTSLDPNIEGPITDPAIKDLIDYVSFRCSHSPTIQSNVNSAQNNGSSIQKFIKHIVYLSRGSMLYLKLLIDLVERGHLVIKSGSFKVLPQSLNEIFLLHFNLKFPSIESFEKVRPILNVCLASLSPLTLPEIFHSVNSCFLYQFLSWEEFLTRFKTLGSFLVKRIDDTYMMFHPALKEWLRRGDVESQKFLCEPRQGHACIALRMSRLEWPLDPDKTLELGHHILKAHLYKSGVTSYDSTARDLQALWVAKSGHNLSAALTQHRNVYSPNLKVSRLLLIAGASPDSPSENPLLTVCASLGHTEMVTLLLEFGANPDIKDSDGRTAMIRAANNGHCDIVNLLYQSGADPAVTDGSSFSALGLAAKSGHVNVVAFLLSCQWPVSEAALIKFIVNALVCAVEAGHLNVVEYLLEMADINVDQRDKITGHSALSMAAHAGHAKIASYLILMGASINIANDYNELPITCAVAQGHYETLELLLKEGVPVDACDMSDTTALMIASREGLLAIMELLFSYGASLSKVNADGLTALDMACQNGHIHAVAYLTDRGADINHVDKFGRTALDLAASHGDPTVVQYLLDLGAVLEHVDINGLRPLDKAIAAGNISAIQCFLKKGAKLGPSTWTMASGKSHILIMLLNKLQEDGVTLCRRGKIKEAAHRFSYALRKLPNSVEDDTGHIFEQLKLNLILNLSRCKRKLNDVQESVNLAEKAIELRPSSYEAFYARARAHKESGNSRQAIQDITTALTLVPPSVKGIRQVLVRIRQEMIDDN